MTLARDCHYRSPPAEEELTDGRVVLRTYRESDVDALFQAARESMATVGRWLPWCHTHYAREETALWIGSRSQVWREGVEYSFSIVDVPSGALLGGCGLNQIDHAVRRANLGYWVRASATGRGYATAAAHLLARWGIERVGFERLEIVAAAANVASQRVAEKAGATREGIARCRLRVRDMQHDAVVFAIVRGDAAVPGDL